MCSVFRKIKTQAIIRSGLLWLPVSRLCIQKCSAESLITAYLWCEVNYRRGKAWWASQRTQQGHGVILRTRSSPPLTAAAKNNKSHASISSCYISCAILCWDLKNSCFFLVKKTQRKPCRCLIIMAFRLKFPCLSGGGRAWQPSRTHDVNKH